MKEEIKTILEKEPKLIKIKKAKKVVFVGDTHGDLKASEKVVKDHLQPGNILVFLGDYVDRGPSSKENLDFLLKQKTKNPKQVFLLQGNHEGHHILRFYPADFWENLPGEEYQRYCSIVERLPLVAIVKDIIALHGAPPDIKSTRPGLVDEINNIELGSKEWFQITWGDLSESPGKYLGIDPFSGRPQFGQDWFFELMKRFNKKILIRSHQPDAPQFMFENSCLTIFTSSTYERERTIAVADWGEKIKDARDLKILKV